MIIKKLTALVLALIMVAAMLTACGSKQNIGELYIDGKKVDTTDLVMMTIDGVEIPFDEFRYWNTVVDYNYFSYGDETYWEKNSDYYGLLIDYTTSYVLENSWGYLLANKYGIELTAEDYDEIEADLASERSYFDSEEEYLEALNESGFTEDLLRRLITHQVLCNRVYEELYGKEDAPMVPDDEEIKRALAEDYVRVHHVLIAKDHFEGEEGYEDATEEELEAAAKAYAEELRQKILDGEEDIYELAQTVGDDPGMIDNEDGYFFTYNEMVEPFEKASFALEVGEVSDIVEHDTYGYFIILRLEQTKYVVSNWEDLREQYINRAFNNTVDEILENAEIVYSEYYDKLTYDSIR